MHINNPNEIEDALKQIPFMKLDVEFDFVALKDEILNNKFWYDYVPPYIQNLPQVIERHKNYKHCTITTVDPSKKSTVVREHFAWWIDAEKTKVQHYYDVPVAERQWYWTDAADYFPKLKELIMMLTDKPTLCKIVRSGTGHGLGWHSHQNDPMFPYYNKPEQCITHIPITTNKEVMHIVAKEMPEKRLEFLPIEEYRKTAWIENFTEGSIWFFNGFWPHAYKNYSQQEDRYTILLYSDLDENQKVRDLMFRNIQKYNGPLIG